MLPQGVCGLGEGGWGDIAPGSVRLGKGEWGMLPHAGSVWIRGGRVGGTLLQGVCGLGEGE